MTGSRSDRAAVLAIALAVLLCWALTFRNHGHDWGGDFSLYIAHARNIAQGRPYAAVHYIPETTVERDIPPQGPPTYPPVFPLVLAPAVGMFGLDYGPLRAYVQFLWIVAGGLFYLYGRRRGAGRVESAAAIAVFLLSSMVLTVKESIVSESTYLVISAAALLYLERASGDVSTYRALHGCVAGLLLLAAYLTRATGIALVAAFAIHELYRWRRLRVFAAVAAVTFIAGFAIYRLSLYDGSGYASQFRITPQTWVRNLIDYIKSPASLWASAPAVLRYPAALFTLVLAGAALVRRFRQGPSVAEFYVVLFLVPLLLYSSGANVRYILPIYPIILLYCAESLRWIASAAPARARRPAFAALALFLGVTAIANVATAAREPEPEGPEIPTFRQTAKWLEDNVRPEEVIACWNPRVVALYTGRNSAYYRPVSDAAAFAARLDEVNAVWAVVFARSETDTQWFRPFIEAHPEQFTRVWQNADFTIYRIRRSRAVAQAAH